MTKLPDSRGGIPQPILFYDGECGFCKGSIRFVLRHDRNHHLLFAPLQGETAADALKDSGLPADIGAKSIVLHEQGKYLTRSRAAFRTMEHMGGAWRLMAVVLKIIPSRIADNFYNLVARYRGRIPAGESCELLPPEQRKRFLP